VSRPSADAAFPVRLKAYLDERFPLVNHGVLIVSYYSSQQFLAKVLTAPDAPMRYDGHSLLGALTLLGVFFHLRVFDEHKDQAEDRRHYPDRVLSRGLVTLRHLKILGGLAIALELACAALAGVPALVGTLLVLGFSLLMLKEFFVRDWLKRHFLAYAVSHMLILPLMSLMIFSFATGRLPWEAPGWYWLYSWVGFFVTFNWEISRKIRAPEQEIEGVDSYTKVLGLYGAAWAVVAVRVLDTGLVALVGSHLGLPSWFYSALLVLFAVCLVGFLRFRFRTSARTARAMETYAGLYIVAFDVILAVAIVQRNGITFR
jgi:4-hydroxybenzoate polyprenyltransferase